MGNKVPEPQEPEEPPRAEFIDSKFPLGRACSSSIAPKLQVVAFLVEEQ